MTIPLPIRTVGAERTLASAPAEKISTLIMRAAGPLFAKIQNDPALVRRYFSPAEIVLTWVIGLSCVVGIYQTFRVQSAASRVTRAVWAVVFAAVQM